MHDIKEFELTIQDGLGKPEQFYALLSHVIARSRDLQNYYAERTSGASFDTFNAPHPQPAPTYSELHPEFAEYFDVASDTMAASGDAVAREATDASAALQLSDDSGSKAASADELNLASPTGEAKNSRAGTAIVVWGATTPIELELPDAKSTTDRAEQPAQSANRQTLLRREDFG